jgi:hypothetical protein
LVAGATGWVCQAQAPVRVGFVGHGWRQNAKVGWANGVARPVTGDDIEQLIGDIGVMVGVGAKTKVEGVDVFGITLFLRKIGRVLFWTCKIRGFLFDTCKIKGVLLPKSS